MTQPENSTLWTLVESAVGTHRARSLFTTLHVPASLLRPMAPRASRAEVAFALNMLLFEDLLRRVPEGAAYIQDLLRRGGRAVHDHGALRTVDLEGMGGLPRGYLAFARLLEPLGYQVARVYPLPRLRMTGRAFSHADIPEDIPQFFVSELHVHELSAPAQAAARRVVADSVDPLSERARAWLSELQGGGDLGLAEATGLILDLAACFDRHHGIPTLADYETLLAESAEMAWISTEGHAFNHATDRVPDVEATAAALVQRGVPMKEVVEKSTNGRVFQTATRATPVQRPFLDAHGELVLRTVPGSFYEFITRLPEAPGRLDLSFDAGNATAIFKMTAARAS